MMTILRLSRLLALTVLLFSSPLAAHPDHALVGGEHAGPGEILIAGMLDGRRDRVKSDKLSVTVNGISAEIAEDGHFATSVPISTYYKVVISGDAIFSMVQTFGNAEIRDDQCGCLNVPPIELVARKEGRIELFFGGDSMAGRRYFNAPRGEQAVLDHATLSQDLDHLFEPIKPYIETSDLASINLESVVAATQPGPPSPKKYLFFSPPELAGALARAGIDHVSLGNNHTADYRAAGVRTTIEALDGAGVAWSGAGMDVAEAERASRFDVKGQNLGIFGFVGWRGTWVPNQTATETKAGAAWGRRSDVERVTKRERRAGYLPIMHFHGNLEYADRPSDLSLPRFRAAIEKGSPLVIGHHPHVTHGLEIYRGGLIAHSLGNFLFDQEHPHTHVTYALKVWLERGKFLRAEVIPLQMLDYRPVPAVGGMREASLRRLHWLSAEMGTIMARSGGHSVVWRKRKGFREPDCRDPGKFNLATFAPSCLTDKGTLGRNLIPRGDFENTVFNEADDRFWMTRNAALDFRQRTNGEGFMAVLPDGAGKSAYLYSRSYIRDIYSTRFTLETQIKLPRAAEIELIAKTRPQEGATPTPSVRGVSIAKQRMNAGDWQSLRFDFDRPEEKDGAARAFRIILKIRFDDKSAHGNKLIEIDDFNLIEWPREELQRDPTRAWWWTHFASDPASSMAFQD
ncbi:MAG: CapA family protein [Pseudomonadota bacterium]